MKAAASQFILRVVLVFSLSASAPALTTLTIGDDTGGVAGFPSIPVELRSDGAVAALQMDVLYDPVLYGPGIAGEEALQAPFKVETHLVQPGQLRVVVHSGDNRALPAGVFFRIPLKTLTEQSAPFPVVLANFVLATAGGGRIDTAISGGVRLANLVSGQRVNGKGGIEFNIETQPQFGEVAKVEYFIGQTKIGEATGAPFTFDWLPIGSGRFEVLVIVTGTNGLLSASKAVPIIVTNVGTTAIRGVYSGLIRSNPAVLAQSGLATFATTALNTFSGKVTLGAASYPVSGTFNGEGVAELTIVRKKQTPLSLWLQLEATNLIDQITGVITDGSIANGLATGGTFAAAITSDRLVWDKKTKPAPQRGSYTIVLGAPDAVPAGAPEGDGFGVVTVADTGAVKLKGTLADGTKVSQSAWLSKDGEWPLFVALYKAKSGGLLGELRFQDIMNTSDFDGVVNWQPAAPAGALALAAVGSRYAKPAAFERMLALQNVAGNALFTAEDGGMAAPLEKKVTVNSANAVNVPVSGADKLALKLTTATGLFNGGFLLADGKTKASFGGAILQKQNVGAGHFLAKLNRGAVALEPNPDFAPGANDDGAQGIKPLPVIKVNGPKKGARIESPSPVTLFGTASAKAGMSAVYYQVLFDGVIGPVQTAQGATTWLISMNLDADAGGPYTVFVKAVDSAGGESELAAATFTYVVRKDLTVNVVGNGTVSAGFAGTSPREVGAIYKITAKAGKGRQFVGWTGDVVSASPTITFTMKAGLELQANFQ